MLTIVLLFWGTTYTVQWDYILLLGNWLPTTKYTIQQIAIIGRQTLAQQKLVAYKLQLVSIKQSFLVS